MVTDLGIENALWSGYINSFEMTQSTIFEESDNRRVVVIFFIKTILCGGNSFSTIHLTCQLEEVWLWFCFGELLQQNLNEVKEHWSSHNIRGSRQDTIKGWPDSLCCLSGACGGVTALIKAVWHATWVYLDSHVCHGTYETKRRI